MKFSNLLIINVVVALLFGVGFVLMPATVGSTYGVTPTPAVNLAGQLYGVELLAIGLFLWFARSVEDAYVRRAMCLAFMIADAIGAVVAAMGVLSGVVNALGWSSVLIYALLALGFAYFQFMQPGSS